ncbi:hypothetical protein SKAU_G00294000 [Synaphobranchus kaupii]|uniref:Uncharacterized protein n=1 Tax=Synaphobranchus kaupii TaxID=118154 RepID=A0A9Q1ILM9_SYNKA|nr:hypothetical protein SKAU_G00294000 [Synaphobranchus kaupii]
MPCHPFFPLLHLYCCGIRNEGGGVPRLLGDCRCWSALSRRGKSGGAFHSRPRFPATTEKIARNTFYASFGLEVQGLALKSDFGSPLASK